MKKMLFILVFICLLINTLAKSNVNYPIGSLSVQQEILNIELLRITSTNPMEEIKIKAENTLNIWRKDEVIDLEWDLLAKKNQQILSVQFIVTNVSTGEQYPYQIIKNEANKPIKLIFQASIAPATTIYVSIKKGIPAAFKAKTFGRHVPERKDDFTWENDKIAFRMYGPALEATGEISSGIDVWLKRTPDMIIDKWYKLNDYHKDNGEGLDCYKVGPTLGAGGIAPVANGKFYYSKNWATYKILYSGNLRTEFELTYKPWDFDGVEVSETKRIVLNAGSQLNQIEVIYEAKGLDTIKIATGVLKRIGAGIIEMNEKDGLISYWEPSSPQNGTTGIGIVMPDNNGMSVVENHLAAFSKAINKKPFKYYQGACWDKAGEIKTDADWTNYLKEFALKVQNPVVISY